MKKRVNKKIIAMKHDANDSDNNKNVTFSESRDAQAENLARCASILKSKKYVPAFEMNRNTF